MNGAGLFFLLLLLLVILPIAGWIGYTRWRAHQRGLPPPPWSSYIPFKKSSSSSHNYPSAPRSSGGPVGWVQDKWAALRSHRTGQGYAGGQSRGFGPLDPDAAWDDRVGAEADAHYGGGADYEEQELGLHPSHGGGGGSIDAGPYGMHGRDGGGRGVLPDYGEERGRSRSREDLSYVGGSQRGLDQRYDEVVHGAPPATSPHLKNPYEDPHDSGLRAVSPRAQESDAMSTRSGKSTNERRSMFREDM